MKVKSNYFVFCRRHIVADEGEDVKWSWEGAGETVAVSRAQAINNVRYRNDLPSQHLPIETSGHYDVWIDWQALTLDEVELIKKYHITVDALLVSLEYVNKDLDTFFQEVNYVRRENHF